MLTLLINETKPLAGLFASTTGGIGSVPDISVADEGQAVSVQTFTRTAGVITDSFVAGDVLHIGIGDGVNAPVCYIELSSASTATGTMAVNTVGMVALFAATVANQLKLTVGVVRTRGGNTNTIFSAPIVIYRSVIDPDTAVPTPSILGTGVAAALLVAINTALGFVRLDSSARLPAVDGSQLINVPSTVSDGDKGDITVSNSGATWTIDNDTVTLAKLAHMPTARVVGRTTAGTGTPELLTISGTGSVAMTTSPTLFEPSSIIYKILNNQDGTMKGRLTNDFTHVYLDSGGDVFLRTTDFVSSYLHLAHFSASTGRMSLGHSAFLSGKIGFKNATSTGTTTLDSANASANDYTATLQAATGTLALVSGDLGTPSAIVLTNASGTASININGTVGANTPSTVVGTTGAFSGDLFTDGTNATLSTYGENAIIFTNGTNAGIFTHGANAIISTTGNDAHITTGGASAYIETGGVSGYIRTRSTFRLFNGAYDTILTHSAASSDKTATFPNATGTVALTSDITGGTLAGSFTTLTASSTTSLLLGTAGSAVGNVGFRNATSGTTTLAPATGALGTGTVTLPLSGTLAISSGANTFTGVQSMTSPDITTSITTPSTTFALVNATATTVNAFGAATTIAMGAAGAGTMNIPLTTSASSATTGALTIGNGTAATNVGIGGGNVNAGGTLKVGGASTLTGTVTLAATSGLQLKLGTYSSGASESGGPFFSGFQAEDANQSFFTNNRLNSGNSIMGGGVNGEAFRRVIHLASGAIGVGPGTATRDTFLHRSAANTWTISSDGASGAGNLAILGTLAVTGASTLTGLLTANGGITLGDAQNIAFNTTTGTKIGAATTQKLSFWNATPIVQPTTAVSSATVVSPGGGVNIKTDDTFDGYTIAQVVKALRNAGLLA